MSSVSNAISRVSQDLARCGVPEAGTEARLIVQAAMGITVEVLLTSPRQPVPLDALAAIHEMVARRKKREPLPYILGWREFFGRRFAVDSRVLIPRPETELVVERSLEWAASRPGEKTGLLREPDGAGLRVADIGTGSGVLAITLALELPGAEVYASDISHDALEVARANAARLGANSITWLQGDLAVPLFGRYHIVVSNPPYLRSGETWEPELAWEPRQALEAGPDGLKIIQRLMRQLPGIMDAAGSVALIEADPITARPAARIAAGTLPAATIEVLPDLAGLDRCVEIRLVS